MVLVLLFFSSHLNALVIASISIRMFEVVVSKVTKKQLQICNHELNLISKDGVDIERYTCLYGC
jgi:hypothetical protein